MGMVTYDGLNGFSAQSDKTDRLKFGRFHVCPGNVLRVRSSLVHVPMRSVHINAKSANQFPAGKRNLLRLVLGRSKWQCREDKAPLP